MTLTTCRLGLTLAVVGLALTGLTACGDDPPSNTPTKSPRPTPTPTMTEQTDSGPVEPELPASAKKPGRKGAEAFVRHYWAVAHYAQVNQQPALLGALGKHTCKACSGAVRTVREHISQQFSVTGGEYTATPLSASRVLRNNNGDTWQVTVRLHNTPETVRNRHGKVVKKYEAHSQPVVFHVQWRAHRWRVSYWETVS